MGAVRLLLALLLVTVTLISNSSQSTDKYVTSRHKRDVKTNQEDSGIIPIDDLPEKYRNVLSKFGGTTNSKGSGKSVKITIKRKIRRRNGNKNDKAEKQSTIFKTANDYTSQGENNDKEPKHISYKNYISSVNSKKRIHKIVPYDKVARARFESMYMYGKSKGKSKGSKYNLRYKYENDKIAPEISDYGDVASYPDYQDIGANSMFYDRPSKRGDAKSWQEGPSVKHSVKVTKHVIRTKTRIPVHNIRESGIGHDYYIDDSSENPIGGILREKTDSNGPPYFEKYPYVPDLVETDNSKDIPKNNVEYIVEDENVRPNLSAKDQIQKDTDSPATIINVPKDQDVIVMDDFPKEDIILEEKPKDITVGDINSANDNPKYVIIDVPSKEKSTDTPKEFSNEYLVNTEATKIINNTPQNTESSDGATNILVPPKRPNSDESNSEDDDHDFADFFKINNDDKPIESNKTKHKNPTKMIVYKKTFEHNIHKHKIKYVHLHDKKQKTSIRPEYKPPIEIIPAIIETTVPDKSEVVKTDNENGKEVVVIPDVIKVLPMNPYVVKELVRSICGTAQQLINRIPDSTLVEKLKQIFKQLTFINKNLNDYVVEDQEFDSDDKYPNASPIIENLETPKDKDITDVTLPDGELRDTEYINKQPQINVKDSLPYLLKILQLFKDYDPKKKDLVNKYPNDSDYYVSDPHEFALSNELNDDYYLPPKNNRQDRFDIRWGPKYDNDDVLDAFVDIITDYINDPRSYVNLDRYMKENLGKILPQMLDNRPTLIKLRKVVEYLNQKLAKNSPTQKKCEARTYKKLLRNAYDFLGSILKLPVPL